MSWNLSNDRPIYLQLMEQIKRQILSGRYQCGDNFPSVRELATEAAVNPNTMQKALAALEQEGLLVNNRTSGRSVTSDETLIITMRESMALEIIFECQNALSALGYDTEDSMAFIEKNYPRLPDKKSTK